ncbi:hypothetical protein ACIGDI_39655 [Streptomyces sp. NPDC085900]|uniref:hypothetical protein n=1 Tax=Streptomyces sp. NPDC085900 TaxID=3365737 RepID=UPI0037D7D187
METIEARATASVDTEEPAGMGSTVAEAAPQESRGSSTWVPLVEHSFAYTGLTLVLAASAVLIAVAMPFGAAAVTVLTILAVVAVAVCFVITWLKVNAGFDKHGRNAPEGVVTILGRLQRH